MTVWLPSMVTAIGYVFYVEQFAGKLPDVALHIDYLQELGASYVHLMKVMQSREGEDDGGYAVTDYGTVDRSLGTNDDLETVCKALREHGISPCIDLVLNHCADEHPWALAAKQGSEHHQQYKSGSFSGNRECHVQTLEPRCRGFQARCGGFSVETSRHRLPESGGGIRSDAGSAYLFPDCNAFRST